MTIRPATLGEDVPLTIEYVEPGTDTPVDPDDQDTDGVADAEVTVIGPDGTTVIAATAMDSTGTGAFEYVWDTETNGAGTGEYEVRVAAEFNGETKISADTIELH